MLDALSLDLSGPSSAESRLLAITDHLDASSSWLVAALIARACEHRGVVVVSLERNFNEILAVGRKVARGNRESAAAALARGTLVHVDGVAFSWLASSDAPAGEEDAGPRAVGDNVSRLTAAVCDAVAKTRAAVARASADPSYAVESDRTCVFIDGADSLALLDKGGSGARVERFLDSLSRSFGNGMDVVVSAHADVGTHADWIDESADCVMRVEPLKTGSAEDVHGTCETTHRSNVWRPNGCARRSRVGYALTELGVKFDGAQLGL